MKKKIHTVANLVNTLYDGNIGSSKLRHKLKRATFIFFLSLVCSPLCLSFHMQQLMKDKPRWLLFILVLLSSLALVFTISHFSTLDMSTDATPPGPKSNHLLSNAQFDCNACEKPNVTDSKLAWDACLDRGAVPEYYLSIVLVTRSDDYATDQRHRLQNMIDSTYILAMRTRMKIELLIIEWNPVIGRQRIKDIFRFVWCDVVVRARVCLYIHRHWHWQVQKIRVPRIQNYQCA